MKKKAEVIGRKRRRSYRRLGFTLVVTMMAGALGFVVFSSHNASSAKRATIVNAEERTFYYLKGDDWQPFEQSYALGFINLGSSEQTRRCSEASYYNKTPEKPAKTICKFKGGANKKDPAYYIDYPAGAWYAGEPYDIREYIWSAKGGCDFSISIGRRGQWYAGSIARYCGSISIREIHFYPLGTLGRNADGTLKTPSEAELRAAEERVHAGINPGSGFRGIMRLDDFDDGGEGYAAPIGYGGIWTTINTKTQIKSANGLESITNAATYKWVGSGGASATDDRSAIWLQFESTPDRPLTLAYYATGHRSSISSQLYTVRYKLSGTIPNTLRAKMAEVERMIKRRKANLLEFASDECDIEEDGTSVCDDDGTISDTVTVPDEDANDHYNNTVADTSLDYEPYTIKQIDVTQHGLYDPYTYYEELMSDLPPGFVFEGWRDADTGTIVPRYSDPEIINSNKTYYGVISIETQRNPGESTCYSNL